MCHHNIIHVHYFSLEYQVFGNKKAIMKRRCGFWQLSNMVYIVRPKKKNIFKMQYNYLKIE